MAWETESKILQCEHVWQRFSASLQNKLCWLLGELVYDLGPDIGKVFDRVGK